MKGFIGKKQKSIIVAYFEQRFEILALIFRTFGRSKQIVGKFSENFQGMSKENCEKSIDLAYFSKSLYKPWRSFSTPLEENNKLLGNFERLSKIPKKSLKKIAKNPLF